MTRQCEYIECTAAPLVGFRRCRAHLRTLSDTEFTEDLGRMHDHLADLFVSDQARDHG